MSWDLEAILKAVRDRLNTQITELGGRTIVVADESLIPLEAACPMACVKDAGPDFGDLDNQEVLTGHKVAVSVFVSNLRDPQAAVIGGPGTEIGIQALFGKMITALKDQKLGLSVFDMVRPVAGSGTGTEVFVAVDGSREIIRKGVTWLYNQMPSI